MPKIDKTAYEAAAESSAGGGESKRMEPGIYSCIITGVQTEWETTQGLQKAEDKQCVRVILDVAEGDFAGEFGRDFYEGRDWMHAIYMSWKPQALGLLKHTFAALDEANPGFDSMAAFEADKWTLFVGKKCLVAWNGRERTNDKGYTNVNVRPDRFVKSSDKPRVTVELENGGEKVTWAQYQDLKAAPKPSTGGSGVRTAYADEEIPF